MVEFVEDECVSIPTFCEKSIWKLYKWGSVIAPIILMLSHWYIFYVFSQNSQEVMRYLEQNEICIAWIYVIIYLVLPLITLPASYLYRWCNLFRVPYVYFIFINIERWYYDSWFCTNEMIDTHYILIYCILAIYVFELIGLMIKSKSKILSGIKSIIPFVVSKIRGMFHKKGSSEKYNEIVTIMEERKHES